MRGVYWIAGAGVLCACLAGWAAIDRVCVVIAGNVRRLVTPTQDICMHNLRHAPDGVPDGGAPPRQQVAPSPRTGV